jgi:hypothetical protein
MNQDVKREAPPAPARLAGPTTKPERTYQPPTLTEKRALAEVTLFSGACTPGTPGCQIGHP